MKQIAQKNHYVPRLYLKKWSDTSNKIWRYRLLVSHENVPKWDHPSIESVACHDNLYTFTIKNTITDEFEEWFNKEVETSFQIVNDKIINDKLLNQNDIQILTKFVAAQYVRTPARLRKQLKFYDDKLSEVIDRALKKSIRKFEQALEEGTPIPKRIIDDSSKLIPAKITIEDSPDNDKGQLKYEVILGRGIWLYEIKHVIQKTSRILINHSWEIIKATRGVNWCTSDDPVICLNYYGPNRYDFNGGWNRKGSEIILPLTPNHVLYTKIGCTKKHPEFQEDPSFTFLMQKFVFEHADRNIFSIEPFDSITSCRDRTVDAEQFKKEADMWKGWHEEQNKAEQNLLNNT